MAELEGMSPRNCEDIKDYLSETTDRVRRAYRRNEEDEPRRCIFIGTANMGAAQLPSDRALIDRLVSLHIVKENGSLGHVKRWLTKHRKELFSAALHDYEKGNTYQTLPERSLKAATEQSQLLIFDEYQVSKDAVIALARDDGKKEKGYIWIATEQVKPCLRVWTRR